MINLWWTVIACITTATTSVSALSPPQFDLSISHHQFSTASSKFRRRDDPAVADLQIQYPLIFAEAQVGTPPQALTFQVITGGGDTLILSVDAQQCPSVVDNCTFGAYDSTKSSSYSRLSSDFNYTFVDGSGVQGQFFTDDAVFAGTRIETLQIGLVTAGTVQQNLLGLGSPGLEASPNSYTNLPYRFYANGTVNVVGFSIWFDSSDYLATGKLALGGVDTKKFNGTLEVLPIVTTGSAYQFLSVSVSSVTTTINGNAFTLTASSANYTIDSGSSISEFPSGVVEQLRTQLGFVYQQAEKINIQPYSEMKNTTTIGFVLGSDTTIAIDVASFAIPYNSTHAQIVINTAADSTQNLLGLSFFRNAYVVVDYTHNQISLAQTVYNKESNLTFIGANGTYGLTSTVIPEDTSTTTDTGPTRKGSSNTKIGIGVGVGVGIPLLIALIAGTFVILRRRKRRAGVTTSNSKKTSLIQGETSEYAKAELHGIAKGSDRQRAELDALARREELEANSPRRPLAELAGSTPRPQELAAEHTTGAQNQHP